MTEKKLTHVVGTFLIQADASFLNGAGLGAGEDQNVTIPKTFQDGRYKVPYVSAQAWKRWLRNTLIEETKWTASEPKAIGWNPKGNVNKLASELNPVDFPEDDVFGYMRAEAGQGRKQKEGLVEEEEADISGRTKTKSVMRASPFMASLLVSLRSTGWQGRDEGFVHLTKYNPSSLAEAEVERFLAGVGGKQDKNKNVWDRLTKFNDEFSKKAKDFADNNKLDELRSLLSEKAKEQKIEVKFIENPCSPVPYTTQFYNTNLQGIFCLNYNRLGVYWNLGDRIELEEIKAKKLLADKKIKNVTKEEAYKKLSDNGKSGNIYQIVDEVKPTVKERASALFNALAVLRGGAKQAQFGTDIAPKALILAGTTSGNPIFNHLFKDEGDGPSLKIETLKEIISDYSDRIVTPVIIGIRSGYLKNEEKVKKEFFDENNNPKPINGVKILVMTPIEAAKKISECLP
jgi:CRISPR-associated autoregulator DevR family